MISSGNLFYAESPLLVMPVHDIRGRRDGYRELRNGLKSGGY